MIGVYKKYNDTELINLLRRGDERAFTEIYDRYSSLLYIFAYKKLCSEEDAKDVVQEIFISLWNRHAVFFLESSLSSYLYKAVNNRALNLFVHRKYQAEYINSFEEYLLTRQPVADHLLQEKELSAIIEREIAALPEKMREVFELSRKEYLSHKEIAVRLGISELTVRTQVKKALRILRPRLGLLVYLVYLLDK